MFDVLYWLFWLMCPQVDLDAQEIAYILGDGVPGSWCASDQSAYHHGLFGSLS